MKVLKKVLQKRYCSNCRLIETYKRRVGIVSEENKKLQRENDAIRRITDFLMKNVNADSNAIHVRYRDDSITIITLKPFYDYQCRLERLEFEGYFFNTYENQRIISQTLSVDVVYSEPECCTSKEKSFLKCFYLASLECTPNKGYGSALMEQFIKYIKPFGADYVSGIITNFDASSPEHKNRLFHFYQKFGFTIGDVNDKGDYPIKLNLR